MRRNELGCGALLCFLQRADGKEKERVMSVEGYKAIRTQWRKELQEGLNAGHSRESKATMASSYATMAVAEILEAIHQRLMNLALKGDK